MFPYPSGDLHLGHLRNYIFNDIINRWKKNFFNFISPIYMGWDCFGTPAENISILNNTYPSLWIKKNIFFMKLDFKKTFIKINWNNEIFTCEKKFYYFNLFLLLNLFKKKFIYLDNKIINWDLSEKTILSNEQVINGKGWRSNSKIKKINFLTYYIKLSFYKKELLYELNNLKWPKINKTIQKNWIFNQEGFLYKYSFFINYKKINFFIFNIKKYYFNNFFFFLKNNIFLLKSINIIFNFNKKIKNNFFKNIFFINLGFILFNIFNFINYELYILFKNIFLKKNIFKFFFFRFKKYFFFKFKFLLNNDFYNIFLNNTFNFYIKWKLLDWGVSRQKYWGTTIPSYNCKLCKKKFFNLNKKFLFPKNLKSNLNINILKKNKFFSTIICKFCKNFSFIEPETLDTFFDSSWYYLFYFFGENFFLKINKWFPMNLYIGGIEHSNLHLLYSRFIIKFLRDAKFIIFGEPCLELVSQGMVLNNTYYNLEKNIVIWHNYNDIYIKKIDNKNVFFSKINKKKVFLGKIEKMSKSKKNGLNLFKLINFYGISSLRIYLNSLPMKKDFLWKKKIFLKNFFFLKKILKNIFFFHKKKRQFLKKNFFLSINDKILFLFFKKNFQKIIKFYNLYLYNNIISLIFNFLNIIKKLNIKEIFLNYYIYYIIKIIEPIIPDISFKLIKCFNYKKYYFNKYFFKINLKLKINYLLILNSKKFFFFFIKKKKNLRKKTINLLIFIKKNNNIKKNIFLFKKILNIKIKN